MKRCYLLDLRFPNLRSKREILKKEMQSGRAPKAVFMAFGTKGDVFPVAAVAAALAKARSYYSITVITHAAHESLMRPLSSLHVTYIPISSPPVISAYTLEQKVAGTGVLEDSKFQEEQDTGTSGGAHMSSSWKLETKQNHREECLSAIDQIFGSDLNRHGDFIVINFFALEGWHLAELYRIPCVVAAPYVVPYSAPVSFEQRFQSMNPLLYSYLKSTMPKKVGWDDVVHWMWPLFTDRWTDWRVRRLHLSACPLLDPVTELPAVQSWPSEPLVLYGFSKEVVECPSYWPRNVHVCGFWFLPEDWEINVACSQSCGDKSATSLPPDLIDFLTKSHNNPIFIGLSSIGSMGLMDNPEGMLCVLERVLEAADRPAILFTAGHSPLDAAVLSAASQDESSISLPSEIITETPRGSFGNLTTHGCGMDKSKLCEGQSMDLSLEKGIRLFKNRLFCFSGSVPYLWLFPKCSLIIHHGGSGSTAAALQSGIPQVICPFMLDQFYWAERMAWIGVAPNPIKKQHLIPAKNSAINEAVNSLLCVIKEASSLKIQACAAALGERIRKEEGLAMAVEILCKEVCV